MSIAEVEDLFSGTLFALPDVAHSRAEKRQWAIGKTASGRPVFVVLAIRERDGEQVIRPISTRYTHKKEVNRYEKENPEI